MYASSRVLEGFRCIFVRLRPPACLPLAASAVPLDQDAHLQKGSQVLETKAAKSVLEPPPAQVLQTVVDLHLLVQASDSKGEGHGTSKTVTCHWALC